MIAAVKGPPAALAVLLLWAPQCGWAADDLSGAARELARKTVAFVGRGEPVSLGWRNLSSLGSAELAQARSVFEAALRDAGARVVENPAVIEAQVTISESQSHYLMVEEIRRGDERQVWIASWRRAPANVAPGISLEKKLLWEQAEPILDAVPNGNELLILSPAGVLLRGERGSQTAPITAARPWPRDLRGHLRITAAGFKVNLPGLFCSGTFEPLAVDCRPDDEPWTLDSGSRGFLLANFASSRNYFDGRVVMPNGVRKNIAPFYTAGVVEDQGRAMWVLTMVEGRAQLFDSLLEPAGIIGPWGSDLAGTEARCGSGTQVLATKAGDAREPDALRAWSLVNRAAVPLTPAMEVPGPVTALWSLGGPNAVAVVRDLASGKYVAYLITVVCGG
jgi:hypothetical protein